MGNKNFIANRGIIKPIKFVSISNKGKASINAKNTYLLNLAIKALSLKSIGCNFVVDRVYKHDSERLTNETTCHNSKYDKKNTIADEELQNVLNMVNLFIEDRQFFCRNNDNGQLLVTVVRPESRLIMGKSLFIREKSVQVVTVVESFDLVTNEVVEDEEKVRTGMRMLSNEDKENIFNNFSDCDNVLEYNGEKVEFTSYFKKMEVEENNGKKAKNV